VPIDGFENAGRQQFILLLMSGLMPASKVVDIGCGVLRAGYWLIHFLDPHCYYGIEPSKERIDAGLTILEPATQEIKQPRFDLNADFDTGVFGRSLRLLPRLFDLDARLEAADRTDARRFPERLDAASRLPDVSHSGRSALARLCRRGLGRHQP